MFEYGQMDIEKYNTYQHDRRGIRTITSLHLETNKIVQLVSSRSTLGVTQHSLMF